MLTRSVPVRSAKVAWILGLSIPLAMSVAAGLGTRPHDAQAGPPLDCDKALSTYELNACSVRAFEAADAKLNTAYAKVLAFIAKSGGEKPYDPVSWEKALRDSQRAWITFRDADCDGLVPMSWGGGTGTTSAALGCKTAKTQARTAELTSIYAPE